MNHCEMIWSTAGTNRVCGRCLSLKDTVVGRTNEVGVQLPPLHPRCRCTIIYRETSLTSKPMTAPSIGGNVQPNSNSVSDPLTQQPKPFKSIGSKHYAVIQVILANAPVATAAQVWSKFENLIQIGKMDMNGYYYYHEAGVIYFNLAKVAAGDAVNKPYQILFHEGAHNIDYLNRQGTAFFSEIYQSGALIKALNYDFTKLIETECARLKTNLQDQAYESLVKMWKKKYPLMSRSNFSDLLDAHTNGQYTLGVSHGKDYWLRFGSEAKSREAFADFMDAAITNSQAYAILSELLPNTTKVFEQMLVELLKRGE